MRRKKIILLIGQKGSGKSYIGTLLDKGFGIKFIRVEDWAKSIRKDKDIEQEKYQQEVFSVIEHGIRDCLEQMDILVFESTGLTVYFDNMLERLKREFEVTTIGVVADSHTCLHRVKNRDRSMHIDVSDKQVLMINQKVKEKDMITDFLILNEQKSEHDLLNELRKIIERIHVR